jgi:hypothetical protein
VKLGARIGAGQLYRNCELSQLAPASCDVHRQQWPLKPFYPQDGDPEAGIPRAMEWETGEEG